ncbi:MAG: hypothetical protein KTR32_25260 [Granulosicoccus sp.]|nr:hypothetical protein [Granulosicoccus sp.]
MNIIKTLLGKWYVVAGCIAVALVIGMITQKTSFESEASLIFKAGREYLYQPEFGDRRPIAASRTDMESHINAESHIMGSTEVLRIALQQVGIERFLGEIDPALNSGEAEQVALEILAKELSIRSVAGTTVIRLALEHADPTVARDTLQAVLSSFLERRKEIYRDSSLELMQRKLEESHEALQVAEADLRAFSTERNIYSFDEQINSLTQQRIDTDEALQNLEAEKNEIELRLKLTRERAENIPQTISLYTDTTSNSVYEDAKNQLFKLQLERNRTIGKYREDSSVVQQLKNEISQLETFIAEQKAFTTSSVRQGRNPAYDELLSQQIELESRLGSIVGRLESMRTLADSLQAQRASMDDMRVAFETRQANVNFLRERQQAYKEEVEKAQLSNDVSNSMRSSARILQQPTLPTNTSGVTGFERLKISALLGLLAGIAILLGLSLLKALTREPLPETLLLPKTPSDNAAETPERAPDAPAPTETRSEKRAEIHGIPILGKISAS